MRRVRLFGRAAAALSLILLTRCASRRHRSSGKVSGPKYVAPGKLLLCEPPGSTVPIVR